MNPIDFLGDKDCLPLMKRLYTKIREGGYRWEVLPNHYVDENDDPEEINNHLSRLFEDELANSETRLTEEREDEIRHFLFKYPTSKTVTVQKNEKMGTPLPYDHNVIVFDFDRIPLYLSSKFMDEVYERYLSQAKKDFFDERKLKQKIKDELGKEEEVFRALTELNKMNKYDPNSPRGEIFPIAGYTKSEIKPASWDRLPHGKTVVDYYKYLNPSFSVDYEANFTTTVSPENTWCNDYIKGMKEIYNEKKVK